MDAETRRASALIFDLIALAIHLVVGFFVVASGLVAPMPVVLGLAAAWIVATGVGIKVRHKPGRALTVALAMALLWVATIVVGSEVFGWTA